MSERSISVDELRAHASPEDLWIAIRGVVYDVSEWAQNHPGGVGVITACTGRDATRDFDAVKHSDYAVGLLRNYAIGKLATTTVHGAAPKPVTIDSLSSTKSSTQRSIMSRIPMNAILLCLCLALVYIVWFAPRLEGSSSTSPPHNLHSKDL